MQQESITTLYHIEIQKVVLNKNGNLERHEVSKIEDRVPMPSLLKIPKTG